MKKIGLSLDFNNICKEYNTVYLDRDNTDRETMQCMRQVMEWFSPFMLELMQHFDFKLYRFDNSSSLALSEMVRKRFFFYSLEKEIIAQTFILQKSFTAYESLKAWGESDDESLIIQNDAEGGAVYFYCNENGAIHHWLKERLKEFSIDEVPFDQR